MAADKSKETKKSKDIKMKVDSGVNLPTLLFFVALGSIFITMLTLTAAMAGFIFLPPLTSIAAALATAMVALPFYRLFLYASATRSVLVSRIVVSFSAAFAGYIHICMVMSILEGLGEDPLTTEMLLANAGGLLKAALTDYFLHPLAMFESYLYYGGGWAATMLTAPISMVFFGMFTVGGVLKRRSAALRGLSEDPDETPEPPPGDGKNPKK